MPREVEQSARGAREPAVTVAACVPFFLAFLFYGSAFAVQPQILLGLMFGLVAHVLTTIIHEGGHALGAKACGWRIVVFAVRPFGLQIPNRDLTLFAREFEPGIGGWVLAVPPSAAKDSTTAAVFVSAAGPAANFLFAGLCLVGAAGFLRQADTDTVLVSHLAIGFAFHSLGTCIFSLLPSSAGWPSDGQKLWRLKRREVPSPELKLVAWLSVLLKHKVRLKDLPAWMLEAARQARPADSGIAQYLDTIDIGRTLDSTPVDAVAARLLIESYRSNHGQSDWLASCDAYLAAMWEADAGKARAALPEGPGPADLRPLILAAQAAVAARERDVAQVASLLEEMHKALRASSPFRDPTFMDITRQIEALTAEGQQVKSASSDGCAEPAFAA